MIYSKEYTMEENSVQPKEGKCPDRVGNKDRPEEEPVGSKLKIHRMDKKELEIDFIGFHFSLVNSFRRIVLAEVATMAIEKVHMYKNTSVVQDEVLSHRLGLVPLNVPPHLFQYKVSDTEQYSENTTVQYQLKVKFRGKKESRMGKEDEEDKDCAPVQKLVTAGDLVWVPLGSQESMFAEPLTPIKEETNLPECIKNVNTDLVLAKLNPGQCIQLDAFALKGIGSDHAKFQPGLCWYRMLPEIKLNNRVLKDDARLLQKCFSPGVIDVFTNEKGEEEAVVRDSRYDSCSRNIYNYENIKEAVEITRNADHIIFSIESESALKSYEILQAAVDVMISKCDTLLTGLSNVHAE